MNKLIKPLIVTLIGLSLSSCDPEVTFIGPVYTQTIQNDSDQAIKWLRYSLTVFNNQGEDLVLKSDTTIVAPHTRMFGVYKGHYFPTPEVGEEETDFKERCISNFNHYPYSIDTPIFKLYVGDELINEWMGPSDYLGDTINSPYNYDSWEVIAYDKVLDVEGVEVVHGELVFTITNDDLN
ncbi:hypothetical protein N9V23_01400 [Flavobacteriales bacterium]|jgi:hypothetical protein|nr:hypothetical protein [Flavobacteriales bacterium]MDB2622103.1 hypothetical protein [Flavobacteriales bacterium]